MPGWLNNGIYGNIVSGGTEVTTTRVTTDIKESLTGIDTKSDAWGKVIPLGFGRVRQAGALVWASQFYKTTQNFDDTVTTKDIYTSYGYQVGEDPNNPFSLVNTPLAPEDMSTSKSQVTHVSQTDSFIDLCYSFGKEGDKRRRRYISKIRINNIIAYDNEANFIAQGLGFSVRYGYDNAPPDLMAKYPNGIYHYKGQTLVIFNRFPLANYGDKIPDSVDVEFGCCLYTPIEECIGCGVAIDLNRSVSRGSQAASMIAAGEVSWKPCQLLVMIVAGETTADADNDAKNVIVAEGVTTYGTGVIGRGFTKTVYRFIDQAFADYYNDHDYRLLNDPMLGGNNTVSGKVYIVQIPGNNGNFNDVIVDHHGFQDPAERNWPANNIVGPCVSFKDTFLFADIDGNAAGSFVSGGDVIQVQPHIQQASVAVTLQDGETGKDGPDVVASGGYYMIGGQIGFRFPPCSEGET